VPGSGPGTQWIELYNPTDDNMPFWDVQIYQVDTQLAVIPTPTPPVLTPTPYPFDAGCFLYMAYDAAEFYSEYNQCPDYAEVPDVINCPDTRRLHYWQHSEINNTNETLCVFMRFPGTSSLFVDAVGWGTSGSGTWCGPVEHPLPVPATMPGVTYLRGGDDPWIGPGAEGEELPDQPLTEELAAVWNLSSEVNVPWAGPEAGACRVPTAVTLQHTQAHTAQNSGLILAFFGFIGLLILAVLWKP
jgi:hypothetical protein